MNLYLALSCLQGRPMQEAAQELLELDVDGLQLTAGNAPTVGFLDWVAGTGIPTRTHHGFTDRALRQPVWDEQHALIGDWDSVHPPHRGPADWMPDEGTEVCLEVMYPGEPLGREAAVEAAMERKLPLAVDVSHIHIQLSQGAMSEAGWRRLQDYPHIAEIHLSANDGRRDSHKPLDAATFGLTWAREQAAGNRCPLIVESYLHKLDGDDRRRQIDLVRGR